MEPNNLNVLIQWHSPDQQFAAVLVIDGEPWYLDGAVVGLGETRGHAVENLTEIAKHLVIHGENFLTEGQISIADRQMLFKLFDWGDGSDEWFQAFCTIKDLDKEFKA